MIQGKQVRQLGATGLVVSPPGLGKSERVLGACLRQGPRPAVIASKYMPLPLPSVQDSPGWQQTASGSTNHRPVLHPFPSGQHRTADGSDGTGCCRW